MTVRNGPTESQHPAPPRAPRHKAPPRAPRHPTSCRRYSKLCCADFRAVLNRKFRRDNRRYLREEIPGKQNPWQGEQGEQ